MQARSICLAVAAALLAVALPLRGQDASERPIQGVVVAEERPVSGAVVRIPGEGPGVLTDGEGRFQLRGAAAGAVLLRVEAVGYRALERTLSAAERAAPILIELEADPVALRGVVATATPLRGGVAYQPARALDDEALQRRAAVSFGQMLDGEPGIAMRSFGPATARPVIRGLDGDRIAVLENGQRMGDISETAPDHAIALDPLTADRVEVVRGPASLLYGSSALGGVVNLLREDIPRSWTPGARGTASVQGASVNREGALAARGVAGSERWAGTARLAYRGGGDFRTPGTPEGTLLGTHSRRYSAGAGAGYAGDRLRGGLALDLIGHDFGIPEELDDPDEEVEIRSARQRLSGELDWNRAGLWDRFELRAAATRFFQQEVETAWESDGTFEEDVEHEFTRHTFGTTLTAAHGAVGPFGEGALGISLLGQTLAATGEEEFHPNARAISAAAFLFEEAPITGALRLLAGARVEAQRMEALPNEAFPELRDERTSVIVSGSIGLNLRPATGLEVGGQLARAHRVPLVEELYSDGPHLGTGRYEIGNPNLPNEIGYGADLFGRYAHERVAVEIAGFLNRVEDFVVLRATGETDPGSGFPVHVYEAAGAELLGGEASLEVRPAERVTLRGTADVVRGTRLDPEPTPLPYMPPARVSLEAEYDAGRWWVSTRSLTAAAQHRVANESPTDGYTLLDLQVGLRPGGAGGHMLVLRMDNVLDTVYRDHLSRVEDRRFPMPGRNLSLAYRWRF